MQRRRVSCALHDGPQLFPPRPSSGTGNLYQRRVVLHRTVAATFAGTAPLLGRLQPSRHRRRGGSTSISGVRAGLSIRRRTGRHSRAVAADAGCGGTSKVGLTGRTNVRPGAVKSSINFDIGMHDPDWSPNRTTCSAEHACRNCPGHRRPGHGRYCCLLTTGRPWPFVSRRRTETGDRCYLTCGAWPG